VNVLRMGNPLLNKPSRLVSDFNNPALDGIVLRLLETKSMFLGAGIAAPQIGFDLQIICFGGYTARYPCSAKAPEAQVLINPSYQAQTEDVSEAWEGCLSVPGMKGLVSRFEKIKYTGVNLDGDKVEGIASGYIARVIQHECDHLQGILFPQRVKDMRYFGFEEELTSEVVL
jgi:peptide deformylase